jgi:sugar lactone lactonase YvrE
LSATTTTIGLDAIIAPDLRDGTGESPVWDPATGQWTWIDVPSGGIRRFDPSSGTLRQWRAAERIGSMVLRPNGGPVLSCESGIFDADLPDQGGDASMTRLVAVNHPKAGMRFNDGRCDRQGRLWVSTMVMDIGLADPSGRWYRYDRRSGLQPGGAGLDGMIIPNGSAFSPDGRTLYASDTHRDSRMVWAWNYDPETGTPRDRRVFVDMRDMAGRPDGAAMDTDGCYWICCLDEGAIKRFTPDGALDRVIRTPMLKPTMCAFGGPNLRTMLVTSLCRGTPEDLAEDPHGGRVLMFDPGAQGIAEPRLSA